MLYDFSLTLVTFIFIWMPRSLLHFVFLISTSISISYGAHCFMENPLKCNKKNFKGWSVTCYDQFCKWILEKSVQEADVWFEFLQTHYRASSGTLVHGIFCFCIGLLINWLVINIGFSLLWYIRREWCFKLRIASSYFRAES